MPLSDLLTSTLPPPTFNPSSLLDLSCKVYLLTFPYPLSSTHLSLLKTLYTFHATIYIGCPSLSNYINTSTLLQERCQASKGRLKPFVFDPTDLGSVRTAAQTLLGDGDGWRLDVMFLDTTLRLGRREGQRDAKDVMLYLFLLAKLLGPRMQSTASHSCHFNPSIRVVWISRSDAKDGVMTVASIYHLAHHFADRGSGVEAGAHAHPLPNSNRAGVQHVVVDMAVPGGSRAQRILRTLMPGAGADPEREACTLLYAGLAPDVRNGDYVVPWGRKSSIPDSVMASETGGAGSWEWCDQHTKEVVFSLASQ